MSTTGSRRSETEAKIANALFEMLNDGVTWREVTVEKIAAAAGIKRTLFYVYYPDRNAVLIRLGKNLVESTISGIASHFFVEDLGRDGIRVELERFIGMMRENQFVSKALMDGSAVDQEIEEFWRGLVSVFVDPTARWIDELKRSGGIAADVNSQMTAFCLVVMTGRLALHPLANDPKAKDDLFEAVVSIWTKSLYGS